MTQDMINAGIGIVGTVFGWVLRTICNAVTAMRIDAMNFGVAR